MEPITREETYLAKAAGQNVKTPEPITRVEHFLKNLIDHISQIGSGGGGGGSGSAESVQSDWNQNDPAASDYVKNRTHYEEGSGATIEWDGSVDAENPMGWTKISDDAPTKEELLSATLHLAMPGNSITGAITEENLIIFSVENGDSFNYTEINGILVVNYDSIPIGEGVYNEPGTYFMNDSAEVITEASITYGSTTIKTLDEKFIPDTIARVKDVTTMINEALGAIENGSY